MTCSLLECENPRAAALGKSCGDTSAHRGLGRYLGRCSVFWGDTPVTNASCLYTNTSFDRHLGYVKSHPGGHVGYVEIQYGFRPFRPQTRGALRQNLARRGRPSCPVTPIPRPFQYLLQSNQLIALDLGREIALAFGRLRSLSGDPN